ncbi:polysaccharide deacetylase family protein [Natrialbaceae archaeon GCM10025810]|uniref:polysaccharide deacetylase family protein n=1 Tax=Halovalidus salilacus TaxID=3075124 RepID=UPI0036085AAD
MNRRAYLAAASTSLFCLAGCTDDANRSDGGNGDPENRSKSGEGEPDPDTDDVTPASGTVDPGPEDDFSDLSAWEVVGGTLSAETDRDRISIGEQTARLETEGERARLSKEFDEPVDVSNVVPGLAFEADELVVPRIRLADERGRTIDYRRGMTGDIPLSRYNFGVERVDDGYDRTAVTTVNVWLYNGEDDRPTVWLDDFHFVPRPETPKVMIQFDDCHVTDYTEAFPILEEYGYPAVTFVNPEYVERGEVAGDTKLSVDQLSELDDAGWCVANHTASHPHLSELSREEQETEILDGQAWFDERGFEEATEYFAYPFGDYDGTTVDLIAEHHELGFAGGGPAHGHLSNAELVPRIGDPSPERSRNAVEWAVEMNGFSSMFFHRLEDPDLRGDFEAAVEAIHEYESRGDLEVILPSDLAEYRY